MLNTREIYFLIKAPPFGAIFFPAQIFCSRARFLKKKGNFTRQNMIISYQGFVHKIKLSLLCVKHSLPNEGDKKRGNGGNMKKSTEYRSWRDR